MKNFQLLQGTKRTDYCYLVYKEICRQNPDITTSPFRHGIDRATFPTERCAVMSQNGGQYNGPTVEALIAKILKADSVLGKE